MDREYLTEQFAGIMRGLTHSGHLACPVHFALTDYGELMRLIPVVSAIVMLGLSTKVQAQHDVAGRPGPSRDETKAWIEHDMAMLTRSSYTDVDSAPPYPATSVRLDVAYNFSLADDCTLHFQYRGSWTLFMSGQETNDSTLFSVIVPLAKLDAASFRVEQTTPPSPTARRDGEALLVLMDLDAAAGSAILVTNLSSGAVMPDHVMTFPVRDRPSGERIIHAIARAAELCGAKRSPF